MCGEVVKKGDKMAMTAGSVWFGLLGERRRTEPARVLPRC